MSNNQYDMQLSAIKQVLSKQLFFIGGAQKSGTTWLQHLLDSHPAIVCSGEGHFADAIAVPLGHTLEAYNRRQDLIAERVYENKPFYTPYTVEEYKFMSQMLTALMMSRRGISDDIQCIGDKTPINIMHLPLLVEIFPDAKFVHIIRDGRDVVVSIVKHAQRVLKEKGEADWTFENKTGEFAEKWASYVEQGLAFAKKYPNNYWEVRYEDLKKEPEKTLASLLKFLGVDNKRSICKKCLQTADFKRLSGGRKPGEEDPNSFFRKGIVGDWQNHLDENTQRAFLTKAGTLLGRLGY